MSILWYKEYDIITDLQNYVVDCMFRHSFIVACLDFL